MTEIPARVTWTVEQLDVAPDDRILEIGCGPGVAVGLVCEQLDGGRITAIDRSAVAVERTRRRNAGCIAAGRAVVEQVDLAAFRGEPDGFDKAFGININVFWTGGADPECAVLARVLRPGGAVHLVYGGPTPSGPRDVGPAVAASLSRYGFATEVTYGPDATLLCITGVI